MGRKFVPGLLFLFASSLSATGLDYYEIASVMQPWSSFYSHSARSVAATCNKGGIYSGTKEEVVNKCLKDSFTIEYEDATGYGKISAISCHFTSSSKFYDVKRVIIPKDENDEPYAQETNNCQSSLSLYLLKVSDPCGGELEWNEEMQACTAPQPLINTDKSLGGSCPVASVASYSPNPINYAIGNKFYIETDYRGRGVFPLVFRRTYNSFDKGWSYSYEQFIEVQSDTSVAVHHNDGRVLEFTLKNGAWSPDPDVVTRLEGSPADGWTYYLTGNTQERYDTIGRLTHLTNKGGQTQYLKYSDTGFIVYDPAGHRLEVTYNGDGKPAQVSDEKGRSVHYKYADQQLVEVTYTDGTNKQYLHEISNMPWLITGILDENGHRSHTVAYDKQGRAIMSELADGADRTVVKYHEDGSVTLTNALGKKSHVIFKVIHGVKKIVHVDGEPTVTCQGSVVDYAYDDNGFLTEKTDAKGIVTRYTRDDNGLALSRTEAVGTPEERTVTTEWDTERRLPLKVTTPEQETTYRYNASGLLLGKTVQANQ